MKITKGIKLHVAAKQFEFFEIWQESSIELKNDISKKEIETLSANLFNELKNEVVKDSIKVLDTLNLPFYDNIIAKINSTTIPNPVTTDKIDILADIENLSDVSVKPAKKAEKSIDLTLASIENILNAVSSDTEDPALTIESSVSLDDSFPDFK